MILKDDKSFFSCLKNGIINKGRYYEKDLKNIQKTLDLLEEDDDVQEVYHNWDE